MKDVFVIYCFNHTLYNSILFKIDCLSKMYIYIYIYTEGYSESTEPIDAVNILPLARFEPTTLATPPSTTPDTDATNCATETSPKKDVQEALILTATDAVHVVYWFFFSGRHLFRSQVKA